MQSAWRTDDARFSPERACTRRNQARRCCLVRATSDRQLREVFPHGRVLRVKSAVALTVFLGVGLSSVAPLSAQQAVSTPAAVATPVAPGGTITVPSGDLVSVAIQSDIGSRNSNEGDTFAVVTIADYYVRGNLVLPKGSPGYGVVTHIKRAGNFHAGGELTFTVRRLIAPDGSEIACETNGAASDADKETEHNGNAFGQYLLWGVGMLAKRGNDILIKRGANFHVATLQTKAIPVVAYGTPPRATDPVLLHADSQTSSAVPAVAPSPQP